jgi:hypothetical protein
VQQQQPFADGSQLQQQAHGLQQQQRQQSQTLSILSTDRPSHLGPVRPRTPTQLMVPVLALNTAPLHKDSMPSISSPHALSNSNLFGPMSATLSSPSGRGTQAGAIGGGMGLGSMSVVGMGSRSSLGPAAAAAASGGGSFNAAAGQQQQQRQALHALITAAANSSLTVREILAAAPQGLPSSLLSAANASAPGGPPGSLLYGPASRLTSRVLTAAPKSMTSSALVSQQLVGGAGVVGGVPQPPPPPSQLPGPQSQQGVVTGAGAQQVQVQAEKQESSRPGTDGMGEVGGAGVVGHGIHQEG